MSTYVVDIAVIRVKLQLNVVSKKKFCTPAKLGDAENEGGNTKKREETTKKSA